MFYNLIEMSKPKPSFFSDQKPQTPTKVSIIKETKRNYFLEVQQFSISPLKQKHSVTKNKQARSQVMTPKRMTTSYLGNRKVEGDAKYQRLYRDRSEGRSVYNLKYSSGNNNKYKKTEQKKGERIQTDQQNQFNNFDFFSKVEQIEEEYLQNYNNENYEDAAKVLIKILNYAIDFKLPKHFLRTIRQLAEFYYLINKINVALFYFDQCRICAFKLNQPQILIDALIGCSLCCRKGELFDEAILFLKKGLECCWFYNKAEQQLRIYDEFGKIHYLMGDLQKASQFHNKFINATAQPQISPQRSLSKQRMTKLLSQQEDFKICTEIDAIFLASLSIPILNFGQLPPLAANVENLREQFNINTKYFCQFADLRKILLKVIQSPFFGNQMQEPETVSLSRHSSNIHSKKKRFDFIDFKLKQHLKEMGIGRKQLVDIRPKNLQYKEPLDEKVKKKLNQPGLDPEWQKKMVKQIKRDRQNKLFKVQSQIRVRGKNRIIRPEMDHIRKIFYPLCH